MAPVDIWGDSDGDSDVVSSGIMIPVPVRGAGLVVDGPSASVTYRLLLRRGKGGRLCPDR